MHKSFKYFLAVASVSSESVDVPWYMEDKSIEKHDVCILVSLF